MLVHHEFMIISSQLSILYLKACFSCAAVGTCIFLADPQLRTCFLLASSDAAGASSAKSSAPAQSISPACGRIGLIKYFRQSLVVRDRPAMSLVLKAQLYRYKRSSIDISALPSTTQMTGSSQPARYLSHGDPGLLYKLITRSYLHVYTYLQ